MKHIELVREALSKTFPAFEWGDSVRVVTHYIYPGNSFVQVVVQGGLHTFVVSDYGNALRELTAAGAEIENPDKLVTHLVSNKGLLIRDGIISSPPVNADSLGVAIAFVADASKEVAEWLFGHFRIKEKRDFKSLVHHLLKVTFNDYVKAETFTGASNKRHKFDNLVVLPRGKKIIVDPVIHDANSINARVVANFDVRSVGYSNLEQRIIYDDEDNWKSDELNLLQVGAAVIPFSRAPEVLARIAGS
ncbi:hypothetical protein [Acidiferrobacter sp.]|jgi:hypothetical protein|uniref:hypothetical protein n=1 Tax=Acidiferrobacter sp. TaxID=1872107 RepID=UPI00262C2A28|nr:hypothetical protein [Acidiferrobacter sp.]